MLTINTDTARRFILGKQGLWPGRRWRGIEGTEQAMRAMEYLQLDPLQIVARSQDIKLHSRVLAYTPGLWEELAYQQRKFFDWGGWLAVRPMDELPDFRVVMRRERDGDSGDSRIRRMARDHAEAIDEMRAVLHERSIVSNRDFEMASRTRTQSYRGRKDSAVMATWRIRSKICTFVFLTYLSSCHTELERGRSSEVLPAASEKQHRSYEKHTRFLAEHAQGSHEGDVLEVFQRCLHTQQWRLDAPHPSAVLQNMFLAHQATLW